MSDCKLRSAVEAALEHLESMGCDERTYDYLNEHFGHEGSDCPLVSLHKQLKDALKDCTVNSTKELASEFLDFCKKHRHPTGECMNSCPFYNEPDMRHCYAAWLHMPCEVGGVE